VNARRASALVVALVACSKASAPPAAPARGSVNDLAAIEIPLPAAAGNADLISLVLTREGTVFWDGAEVADADVVARLDRFAHQHPDARCVISADARAPHGRVVALIDTLKQHGLTRFALNIESADAGP
jgi:biopolymer transport protein TolR